MEKLLKGAPIAKAIRASAKERVAELLTTPTLAVVQIGADESAKVYTNSIKKLTDELGVQLLNYPLPETITETELLALIDALNNSPDVTGIFLHMPLPAGFDAKRITTAISPLKDVDCVTMHNVGLVATGNGCIFPCTPYAALEILLSHGVKLSGKHVVVIGRSNIVGKPMATMLIDQNATVTLCHSRTVNLAQHTQQADVIVVAVGSANFLTAETVKLDAVVIDVGINVDPDGKLVGDVSFADVEPVASRITPVPGGVGPVTVAMLARNLLTLYDLQHSEK